MQNGISYTRGAGPGSDPEAANRYVEAVAAGAGPLDFVLYVPEGYGAIMGKAVPNVEETGDSSRLFTARFNGGNEVWE